MYCYVLHGIICLCDEREEEGGKKREGKEIEVGGGREKEGRRRERERGESTGREREKEGGCFSVMTHACCLSVGSGQFLGKMQDVRYYSTTLSNRYCTSDTQLHQRA